jgi:cell division protein FtsB
MIKKRRQKTKNTFFSILTLTLFTILIGFLVISNSKLNKKREELKNKIFDYEKEIEFLENKNQSLRAGISKSKEKDYWEEVAREQGYQKPGEKQVVVLPPEEKEIKEERKGIFENFWNWIKEEFKINE